MINRPPWGTARHTREPGNAAHGLPTQLQHIIIYAIAAHIMASHAHRQLRMMKYLPLSDIYKSPAFTVAPITVLPWSCN